MGFRSMIVVEDRAIDWPEWFIAKHSQDYHIDRAISSKYELKCYEKYFKDFLEDIQKVIKELQNDFILTYGLSLIAFHECGGITKYVIYPEYIKLHEPKNWHKVDGDVGTHWYYCYECSEPKNEEYHQEG